MSLSFWSLVLRKNPNCRVYVSFSDGLCFHEQQELTCKYSFSFITAWLDYFSRGFVLCSVTSNPSKRQMLQLWFNMLSHPHSTSGFKVGIYYDLLKVMASQVEFFQTSWQFSGNNMPEQEDLLIQLKFF